MHKSMTQQTNQWRDSAEPEPEPEPESAEGDGTLIAEWLHLFELSAMTGEGELPRWALSSSCFEQ